MTIRGGDSSIYVAEESTYGVDPAAGNKLWLRHVRADMGGEPTFRPQGELNNFGAVDQRLVAYQTSGSIEGELAKDDAFEQLLANLFNNPTNWGGDDILSPDFTETSFLIDQLHDRTNQMQRHLGCVSTRLQLVVTANEPIQWTLDFIGKDAGFHSSDTLTPPLTPLPGQPAQSLPSPPVADAPVMMAHSTSTTWTGELADLQSSCANTFTLTIQNNRSRRDCVGALTPNAMHRGDMEVTLSGRWYFRNFLPADVLRREGACAFNFITSDKKPTEENSYTFNLPDLRVVSARAPNPGRNEIVEFDLELMAYVKAPNKMITLTRATAAPP